MKILVLLTLLFGSAAYGQDACESAAEEICQNVESNFDYHYMFYFNLNEAFADALGDKEMKELIVRNFKRKRGELVPDLDFNRESWFFSFYKRIIKKHGIESCEDFKIFNADENFLLNCKDILSERLKLKLPKNADERLRNVLRKVKYGIRSAFQGTRDEPYVNRALDSILDTGYARYNLHILKGELIRPERVCGRNPYAAICYVYSKSQKLLLSVGGYNFLTDPALESKVAEIVARRVGSALNGSLHDERFRLFTNLFYERLEKNRFEKLILKLQSSSELNLSVNALLVLRKYYEEQKILTPELFVFKAGYACYRDERGEKQRSRARDREEHYSASFNFLHPVDAVKILTCEEDPSGGGSINFALERQAEAKQRQI